MKQHDPSRCPYCGHRRGPEREAHIEALREAIHALPLEICGPGWGALVDAADAVGDFPPAPPDGERDTFARHPADPADTADPAGPSGPSDTGWTIAAGEAVLLAADALLTLALAPDRVVGAAELQEIDRKYIALRACWATYRENLRGPG
jgi:hypothetical protein